MVNLETMKVSWYRTVHTKRNEARPLLEVLAAIKQGEVKDRILLLQRYLDAGDEPAANAIKSELSCFTPGGVFDGGHAIKNLLAEWATELIILDFDKVKDLERLRALCNADPHTVSSFASPRRGLKVLAHVENSRGRHAEAYALVRSHYEEITGLVIDASGKDVSRTCYMSYDPECYIAALYDSFVLCDAAENLGTDDTDGTNLVQESFAGREADYIRANLLLHPLREGNRNQGAFILGCQAAKAGCSLEAVFANLAPSVCSGDFTYEELKTTLESAYQRVETEKTQGATGKGASADSVRASKRHYGASEKANADEEAYWEGEELRCQTPLIPDEVYENLPDLLSECLEEEMPARQRDVRLLACLTAFSALLPATRGKFNHKHYTPHLFGWVIAPPASGKSAAEAAVHLLDEVNFSIEGESDRLLDQYETDLNRFSKYTPRKRKKQADEEPEPVPQKPKKPAYRTLVIKASTSNSRLTMQLRDNGDLGGYLFDTEAATLANTNKQDFGHIDTLLCQAFEHEPIGSSYFAHGEKPITCQRPRLAMMITGTTLQMDGLLSRPGTGMESRILFYTFGQDNDFRDAGAYEGESTDERFARLSHKAYRLFHFCGEHPLEFSFSRAQWNELNRTFGELNCNAFLEDRNDLLPTVRRYRVCVLRIAMVLSRLEQWAAGDVSARITCSEHSFHTAIAIVLCCYRHCRLLFTALGGQRQRALSNPDKKSFPLHLLSERFTHAEAVKVGESYGFSKRTVERLLSRMEGLKIRKLSLGCYEKLFVEAP